MFLHLKVEGLKLIEQKVILMEHEDLGYHLNKWHTFIRCSEDGLRLGGGTGRGVRGIYGGI